MFSNGKKNIQKYNKGIKKGHTKLFDQQSKVEESVEYKLLINVEQKNSIIWHMILWSALRLVWSFFIRH